MSKANEPAYPISETENMQNMGLSNDMAQTPGETIADKCKFLATQSLRAADIFFEQLEKNSKV